jgi:hypothetical protein
MIKFRPFVLAGAGLLAVGPMTPGTAATIENTSWVQAYNGAGAYPWFSGSSWGANVGAPTYETTQLVVSTLAPGSLDLKFTTGFDGDDTSYDTPAYGNVVVRYADIFINPVLTTAPPGSYGYAIVLGDEGGNGGLTQPGLYQVTSDETSQDIWNPRTQFVYGGEYAPANSNDTGPNLAEAELAPTVVTGGTLQPGWTVTDSYANGVLDVEVSTTDITQFDQLLSNYDLFWGTGDCDNAPIFAAIDSPVPEPTSLALLSTALGGLGLFHRQRRKSLSVHLSHQAK